MHPSDSETSIRQAPLEDLETGPVDGLILEERLGYALRHAQLKVFKHFDEAMRDSLLLW